MKLRTLLVLAILFVFTSCTSNSSQENQQLQDSVIAIHDEIMPLMGGFVRNSIKIDSILNNLQDLKDQSTEVDTMRIRKELIELKGKLDSSTDGMNDWMHDFEVDYEGKTEQEVHDYLKRELSKIQQLKNQFEEAAQQSEDRLLRF